MSTSFVGAMLKDILQKGVTAGTEKMIEEAAENVPVETLETLITLLSKVRDRKKNVVDMRG